MFGAPPVGGWFQNVVFWFEDVFFVEDLLLDS